MHNNKITIANSNCYRFRLNLTNMCVDTEPDRNYRISAARGAHTNVLTARLGEGDSNYWTGTNREMHTQHKSL